MSLPAPGALLRALRPRQWMKNVLVAAAPVAAGALDEGEVIGRTIGAIAVFIAAAGATYLVNDAADVEIDQAHPTKQRRPIAAGAVTVTQARVTAGILAVGNVSPTIRNCRFLDNTCSFGGAAGYVNNGGAPTFSDCRTWLRAR